MVWNKEDQDGFQQCSTNNIGQINRGSELGDLIYDLVKDNNFKIIYDIGCWNGEGTTKCIVSALNDSSQLYGFEVNKDKWEYTNNLYKHLPNVKIINGTVGFKKVTWEDIITVFPHLTDMTQSKYFCQIDIQNTETAELFTPHENIDLVIHDGGEWDSYFIFKDIKDRVNHWILDDTNVDKNKLVLNELIEDTNFELIKHNPKDRNGWAYFKRKI